MTEDVQKGVETLVNCTICTEPFTDPRVLPCQHTFCLACLGQFFESYNQQRIIKMTNFPCPACRKITYLSQGGMQALPRDFKVGQIQDFLSKVGIAAKSRTDICDVCKYERKQQDAKQFCVQCSKYLCEHCMAHHRENSLFSQHAVMDIACTDISVLDCKEHNEEIKYFCVPCSLALCTVCALGKHSKHDTMDVTAALDQKRQIIEDLLRDARQLTQQFEQKAQELEDLKHSREHHFNKTQADIRQHVEDIINGIRDQESQLLRQLEKSHSEAMKLIQKDAEQLKTQSSSIVSWIDSSTELLSPSKSLQLLAAQQHLINKMGKVCQTPLPSASDRVKEAPKFQPLPGTSIGHMVVASLAEEQAEVKEDTAAFQQPASCRQEVQAEPQAAQPEATVETTQQPVHRSTPLRPMPRPGPLLRNRPSPTATSPAADAHGSTRAEGSAASTQQSPASVSSQRNSLPLPTRAPPKSSSADARSIRTPLSPRGRPALEDPTDESEQERPLPLIGRSASMRNAYSRPPTARELKAANALRRSARKTLPQQPSRHSAELKWRTEEYCSTRGVAFTPDGLVVTAEHEDTSQKIELFEGSGEIKRCMMGGSCSIVKPWGITVNNQNSAIIVTDHGDSSVKVLDTDLTVRNIWRLHFSKPCGVAIMRTGEYIISDIGEKPFKLSIHTASGLKMQEFGPRGTSHGHLLRPQYIAADHHDRILVSDCDANCVKIFDRSGKQLSQFSYTDDSRLNMFPQGLCVDALNHILLADQSYSGISMYSSDGRFIEHVVKLDNPPWDVAIHESGLMAVGTDPSLKMYSMPTTAS